MFRARRQRCWSVGAAVVAALGLMLSAAVPPTRGQGNPNPGIIPVNKQYTRLSAEWWQWAVSFPVSNSPLFDETGARGCLREQGPGNVFFLSATFSDAPRNVSFDVPSGSRLFVILVGSEWDNAYPGPPLTVEQLYERAAAASASVTELHASIDGQPVQDLFSYRVRSDPFCYTVSAADKFFEFLGLADVLPPFACPAGFCVCPAVIDGFFLLLTPLPPGTHTVNTGGTVGSPPDNVTFDITYNIRVVPRGHYQGCQ